MLFALNLFFCEWMFNLKSLSIFILTTVLTAGAFANTGVTDMPSEASAQAARTQSPQSYRIIKPEVINNP